ncbi:MAG: hypothetical protein ABH890_02165 [Bacillota bacterium]
MKKFLFKNNKKILVFLIIVTLFFITMNWIFENNIIIKLAKDLSFALTLTFTITININLNFKLDKSKQIINQYNLDIDIEQADSLQDKEINESIKLIHSGLLSLEKLKEKLYMKHLKNRMMGNFIPIVPLKNEVQNISLDELREIKNKLNSYLIIIKDINVKELIKSFVESIDSIIDEINKLKESVNNPMAQNANNYRRETIDLIDQLINKTNELLVNYSNPPHQE